MFISEFTLALVEESGWYKANYYTGGLMRFGKNKGCAFIEKNCLSLDYNITNINYDLMHLIIIYKARFEIKL